MDDQVSRQLQLTMLETLKVFDAFCRKHDMKYSLYAGSLLGAVRHQGFIPWDDDIDVVMPRKDLEKLLKLLGVLLFISTFVVRIVSDVGNSFRHKNQTHYETKTYSKGRRDNGDLLGAWGNVYQGSFQIYL